MPILFHDRSATGRVDRDKGRTRALERRDIAPRERPGSLEMAGVRVERAAAVLPWSIDCRVAVDDQHASGRAICLAEKTVHHATAKQSDIAALAAGRGLIA